MQIKTSGRGDSSKVQIRSGGGWLLEKINKLINGGRLFGTRE